MNTIDLPPLPPMSASSPDVCNIISLYLAVSSDLSREQLQVVFAHVRGCEGCAREKQTMDRATQKVASLAWSQPSERVDAAVLAAFANHSRLPITGPLSVRRRTGQPRISPRLAALAVVAILLLALGISIPMLIFSSNSQTAFALPANLSWDAYVLYRKQTMMSGDGHPYQVETYKNLATGRTSVESVMDGKFDVVVVADPHKTLGMDMMHHIAQWDVSNWRSDNDKMFDLAHLRSDLQTRNAVYLGKDKFQGQDVYRISYGHGVNLLLDMNYRPINVVEGTDNLAKDKPMYDTFKLLPSSHVADAMWDMNVPPGFQMGKLPAQP